MLRLAVGAAVLGLASIAAAGGTVGRLETNVFRLVNDLLHLVRGPLFVVMQAGSLSAVPVVVVLALLGRRIALARDLAVAGTAAWVLAKVVKGFVERPRQGCCRTWTCICPNRAGAGSRPGTSRSRPPSSPSPGRT